MMMVDCLLPRRRLKEVSDGAKRKYGMLWWL